MVDRVSRLLYTFKKNKNQNSPCIFEKLMVGGVPFFIIKEVQIRTRRVFNKILYQNIISTKLKSEKNIISTKLKSEKNIILKVESGPNSLKNTLIFSHLIVLVL